ncbi:MAG: thiolase family protein [Candidatus Hydrogenedentes bacterium]|nr:thiolase family protein [Candidatus Hydrogenedentota bacterium]
MREVVIIDALRTPLGRRGGFLREVHPVRLGSTAVTGVLERAGVKTDQVDHLVWGTVSQVSEQAFNIARNVVLDAGLPISVAATSIDFQCGSGQQAIHIAAAFVGSGQYDLVVAGGVESLTRVPMGSSLGNGQPFTDRIMEEHNIVHQGISSDKIAKQWNLQREDLDQIAFESHTRAAKATKSGFFQRELIPMHGLDKDGNPVEATYDEGIRFEPDLEKMGQMQPVFTPDGVTTAANSSQITDGAAAVIITTPERAKELGLKPRARILQATTAGSDPHLMLTGPVEASRKVLKLAGMKLEDMDLVEINEAFATVVAMWRNDMNADMNKVNIHGGAIALGHPLGCTGARVTTTLLNGLDAVDGRYGLQTICCGGGMATGMILERIVN